MKIMTLKQRTKEWLQWRRDKITASDAPIIMGDSPYKKIDQLYEEKLRCYESTVTQYMQRGIDLEPIALKKFESETGLIMFPCTAEHENGWMAASFDGMTIDGDVIVEIKCPGKKDHCEALLGIIPNKYKAQLQHQLYVSGLNLAYYYSFDGTNGVTLKIERDDNYINKMIEKEKEFLYSLMAKIPEN